MGDNQNRIMVPSRKPTSCSVCNNVGHTKPRCPINKNKPPPPADHAQVAQLMMIIAIMRMIVATMSIYLMTKLFGSINRRI